MCGIVGILNGDAGRQVNWAFPKFMEQAMRCNSVRGDDSTGVMQLDKGTVYVHKKAVAGWVFANDSKADGFLRDADTSLFTVVHNRAATVGKVTDTLAHPFTVESGEKTLLVGVHNGTLQKWDSEKHDVDSEWALAQIAEKGDEAFSSFYGAYAFVWYDEKYPNQMHMARNAERPMFVAFVKDTPRAIFGSEPDMITWLCRRNSILLEKDILELTPGRKYSFDLQDPRKFVSVKLPDVVAARTTYADDWTYYRGSRSNYSSMYRSETEFVSGMKAILRKTGKQLATSVGNAMGEPAKVRVRRVGATAEEERTARLADLLNLEGVFIGEVYDPETRTLWGEAEVDGESASAVMRGVTPGHYAYLQKHGTAIVTIVGAFSQPSRAGMRELALVVQQKAARSGNKDTADTIADAVSEEIESIRRNAALN